MNNFYEVHCTNCGAVWGADRMAVDVDRILRTHLSKAVGRSNSVLEAARDIFDEIKVGMYMTKFQLVNDGVLAADGTLRLSCRYLLDFIERRYEVDLSDIAEEEVDELYLPEDEMDDSDASYDEEQWNGETDTYNDEIISKAVDILCSRMKLYAKVDDEERVKREYIQWMLRLLMENEEFILLECKCGFGIQTDDRDQDFISSLRVTYTDEETIVYRNMVCPKCGEPFFVDAGKYKEHVIVMLGSSRVGKTAYLAALVEAINPEYGQPRYPLISIKDTADRKYTSFKTNILKQYRMGKKIKKTDESKEDAALFSLDVMINEKMIILTFVDLPGEVFAPRSEEEKENGAASGKFIVNQREICHSADVFWFCISPVQIDQRLYEYNNSENGEDKVDLDIEKVFANVGNILEVMGNEKTSVTSVPTAIMITQSDRITSADPPLYYRDREAEPQCLSPEGDFLSDRFMRTSENVRRYLTSNNVRNIIPRLNNIFANRNYFAVAAYGIEVTNNSVGSDMAPGGVILPFLWSLSVLGYLKPVRYVEAIINPGRLIRREHLQTYYEEIVREKLFVSKE